MTKYEEDLAFAKAVLYIRTALEDGSVLEKDGFSLTVANISKVQDYYIELKDGSTERFASLETYNCAIPNPNAFMYNHIVYSPKSEYIKFPSTGKSIILKFNDIDYPTEEWYFQNSLVLNDMELSALTLYKIQRTVPYSFSYFGLNCIHINTILERMNYEY